MKLFWAPQTRSTRAIWMLEELGCDYELELVDIRSPEREDSPAFRAASPMGKVPALEDGDAALAESAAICLYLADRYGSGELAPPPNDPERARFLYWLIYTPAVVEPAMSEVVNKVKPNRQRSGWGDFETMITTWERELEGRTWILGERFTAADVMLGSSAIFLRLFGLMPDSDVLEDYADRCAGRPAYRRAEQAAAR